jgi:mersacidin/lichenicidin family type 2 lantibiotic
MSTAEIIRAWKDPQYRATLTVAPPHPAGHIEFTDPALGGAAVAERGFRAATVRNYGTFGAAGTGCLICGGHTLYTKNACGC